MIYVFRSKYDTAVPAGVFGGRSGPFAARVKRETGANPVRSRHCIWGARGQKLRHWETGKAAAARGSMSQETCRTFDAEAAFGL